MSSVLSYHVFSAFYEEFKKYHEQKKSLKLYISFEPMTTPEGRLVSLQYSFMKGSFIHIFHTESMIADKDTNEGMAKDNLKRATILFNAMREWLNQQKVITVPARYAQRVNGVIDYKDFNEIVDEAMKNPDKVPPEPKAHVNLEEDKNSFNPEKHR